MGSSQTGIRRARTAVWLLLKFMIPVSLGVTLLAWSGWLEKLGHWLAALFQAFRAARAIGGPLCLSGAPQQLLGIGAMGLIPS
jgi:hypothetical protein